MEVLCPVSLGEVLDKISILRIKRIRLADPIKLGHVEVELKKIIAAVGDLAPYAALLDRLQRVNQELWDIEDAIRLKEKAKQFDEQFIALARAVYRTNDQRFEIKNEANVKFGSAVQEQKSYEQY